MYKVILILLFFSTNLFSSDLGITGLIDIPTARAQNDGALRVTFSDQNIAKISNITYQATPWLETTFRYTHGKIYQDRSYAAKILIQKESLFKPSIAIGSQDILGTGLFASEYIVASKKIKDLDISVGLGWGRLAGRNKIKNPLLNLSNSFFIREKGNSPGGEFGGKIRSGTFFKGSHAGIFGGIKYSIPSTNFKFIAEYNSDVYKREKDGGLISDNSPLSYGIEWSNPSGLSLSLNKQQGNFGFSFSSMLDTKSLQNKRKIEPFYSSYDISPFSINKTEGSDFNSWYDRLLYDYEQSGLLLRSAKIYENRVVIEFSNFRYNLSADAINRALTLAQIHVSNSHKYIDLILNEEGFRVATLSFQRSNSKFNYAGTYKDNNINFLEPREIENPHHFTRFIVPNIKFTANLAAKFQLFDPLKPAKHQIYLKIGASANINQTWGLLGSYAIDINNNFDLKRDPGSVLEHVRTDINKYLVYGSSGIESLYFQKKSSLNDEVFYRAYFGILESMYSGFGMEVLYRPFKSRIAFGGTLNRVFKRDFTRNFKLLDYKTTTGFLSVYYASPFYNYDFAIHVGRYLARDKGATIEMRRTFDNGYSIGAFATFTDVSSRDYGEGSFDKGLFFKIPFNSLIKNNSKNSFSTLLRSVQRDGGQKLDDYTGVLWHELRNVRYDSFNKNFNRMLPK